MSRFDVEMIEMTEGHIMIFFNDNMEFEVENIIAEDYYEAYEACSRSYGQWNSDYINISDNMTTVSIASDDDFIDVRIHNHMIADAFHKAFTLLLDNNIVEE
jgi:hypothetical protein